MLRLARALQTAHFIKPERSKRDVEPGYDSLIARYLIGKLFVPILSCFEWSKQVLQHCPGLQLVYHLLAVNLPAVITVITQLLYRPENLNVFATTAAPFDEIDDIDMTAANGLFRGLVLAHLKDGRW